jgi:DNA-binding NarL/FixJ family response regulator
MESPTETIKVIHADDHQLFRQGVLNALNAKPRARVIAGAGDGQELLDLLGHLQPDVILLNIQMPVMDGLQTLPILKRNYPLIKVLILSMHNSPRVIRTMIENGANGYLTKEAGSEEVYHAICACYRNWFYVNKTVVGALLKTMPPDEDTLVSFSPREQWIIEQLAKGKSLADIAACVDLSARTVSAIIDNLKSKTNSRDLDDLIAFSQVR